jgi:hypothetical protein
MRSWTVGVLGILLAGCGNAPKSSAAESGAVGASGAAADEFPQKGEYHVIIDRNEGGGFQRTEMDVPFDASTREEFERVVAGVEVSSCHDRHVNIGDGSFSVKMACAGPGGDVAVERRGRYSKDSLDITYETTTGGMPTSQTWSYRLKS